MKSSLTLLELIHDVRVVVVSLKRPERVEVVCENKFCEALGVYAEANTFEKQITWRRAPDRALVDRIRQAARIRVHPIYDDSAGLEKRKHGPRNRMTTLKYFHHCLLSLCLLPCLLFL